MKKKKVLLAIFASLCVAASASALAACSNGNSQDAALYSAYETYAESTDNPMSYDEWVADIIDQLVNGGRVVGVEDVSIIEDENGTKCFLFTFTDGTSKTVPVDEVVG